MTCTACYRVNLPGGVRCIYCGVPFPTAPVFDLGGPIPGEPAAAAPSVPPKPPSGAKGKGLVGTLAFIAFKAKFLFTLLKLGKLLTTFGSMFIYIAVYSRFFGWTFAAGITVCIFIHEMGHIVVNWKNGIKSSAPMFIPFMGAMITVKSFPDDPRIESECGAGGPAAGMLAAIVCLAIGWTLKSPYWIAVANIGFWINMLNLIPYSPLDGSRIGATFSPRLWHIIFIGILLFVIKVPDPSLIAVLVIGFLLRLGKKNETRYMLAPPAVRIRMAGVYFLLCCVLGMGSYITKPGGAASAHVGVYNTRSFVMGRRTIRPRPPEPIVIANVPAASITLPAAERRHRYVIKVVLGAVVAMILWTITAGMLAGAARKNFGLQHVSLVGAMLALLLILATAEWFLPFLHSSSRTLFLAYALAGVMSLFASIYHYAHRKGPETVTVSAIVISRILAWTAGSGLIVAYTYNSIWTALVVCLSAAVYFALCPSLAFYFAGSYAASQSRLDKALALFEKGLKRHPDREMEGLLRSSTAKLYLMFSRGGPALQALEGIETMLTARLPVVYGQPVAFAPSIEVLNDRATALIHLARFDDALTCCEQILQVPASDKVSSNRLLLIHIRLAELARRRGWADEFLAQVDCSLRMTPKNALKLLANLHCLRADALLESGKPDTVEAECAAALEIDGDARVEAKVALIKSQAALMRDDVPTAMHEMDRAYALLGSNLEVCYWRGQSLVAAGRKEEGIGQLRTLAANYPLEYWGSMAKSALAPPAPAG